MVNESRSRELPLVARKVAMRMAELALSQADLARRTGLGRAYISELLRGDKKTVKPQKLTALAGGLGVPILYFLTERMPGPQPRLPPGTRVATTQKDSDPTPVDRPPVEWMPPLLGRRYYDPFNVGAGAYGKLPLFRSDAEGRTALSASGYATVKRPPLLAKCVGAYAVVADNRMRPRYNAGEILYIAPGSRPAHGDCVHLVREDSGGRLIGETCRLLFFAPEYVEVEFLSPPHVSRFPTADIKHIHHAVMSSVSELRST